MEWKVEHRIMQSKMLRNVREDAKNYYSLI